MAIVRLGPIVSAISGSVGSVVFIAGGRSTVARLRPVTVENTSSYALRSKVHMANIRRYWSTMTDLQKQTWTTAGHDIPQTNALGVSSPMTGFNYFVMTNKTVSPADHTIWPFPAELDERDFAVNPAATFSVSGSYTVQFDNPYPTTGLGLKAYGWPFWRTTKSKDVARLVFIAEWASFSDPVTVDIKSQWLEHFGPLQEGQRYAVGIKCQFNHTPFAPITVLRQAALA